MSQNLPFYFVPIDRLNERECYGVKLILAPWPRGRLSVILKEEDLIIINDWCVKNSCGKRVSYDTWIFDSGAQRTLFMLKWG